jgi:hypothetical protein
MALWATGELATAAKLNTNTGPIYTATQADVLGSRAIDGTVYQNTSGKIMVVTISVQTDIPVSSTNAGAFISVYCDANAAPVLIIAETGRVITTTPSTARLGDVFTVTFIVNSNYYYKAVSTTANGGTITKDKWTEYTLF